MSFVKKALKKVWKVTKKIVKSKVFKYLAVAAAVFFTAGVAAGGFAAFSGVSSIGGFFTAVGQTIATGASSLASMAGLKGTSASLAKYGGAAATKAGLGLAEVAVTGSYIVPGITKATTIGQAMAGAAPTGGGFASTMGKFLSKPILGDVTTGQLLANGATAGFTAVLQAKAKEKDNPNGFVAGGLMRGGSSEAPPAHTYSFGEAGSTAPTTPASPASAPTVAAQLANQEAPQVGQPDAGQASTAQFMGARQGIESISARLAARDQQAVAPAQGGLVMGTSQPVQQSGYDPYAPVRTQATQLQYQRGGLA